MKAVIPAAGAGVRFLPMTKVQPKEMLPIVDKPTIQYVVEEAIAAGITDILIITGAGKRAIEDHFDRSPELESMLERQGRTKELEEIRRISNMVDIHYIRQKVQRGLGDAILCAKKHVGHEPFAVMLGDTINVSRVPVVKQIMEVHEEFGSSVLAVEPVADGKVSDYGIVDGEMIRERLYLVRDLVEKPRLEDAPSRIGITGTYILTPSVFECIERTKPGANGEIQLTDALRILRQREKMFGYWFEGTRYDIGDKLGWMKTNFELTLSHPEFSGTVREHLQHLLTKKAGD